MQIPADDIATFWFQIRTITSLMDRWGDRLFREELGIGLSQFLVLSVVDAHPGELNQQWVADRLGLTKGTVSRQIEAAVAAGFLGVTTSTTSRRQNSVTLTDAGTELVRRGDALMAKEQLVAFEGIEPADFTATLSLLGRFVETLKGV
jgi:DNA-binding MarR family transcriptional regulator